MLVMLERGGGVAGGSNHERLGPIDTEAANAGAGRNVEQLVVEADFFAMEDDFPHTGGRSDPTWSSVRVVDGDADRTVRWDANQTIPGTLRALRDLCASIGEWQRVQ